MSDSPDITDILRQLVAFPTVSSESNLDLIGWVEQFLDARAVPHWRVNASETKCSLLARIGPDAPGGIVLSGHTDVVPVKAQPWASDPFTLTERGGALYGRGASDMKGFLACCLAAIPEFQRAPLKRPVWLAFSHDEEIGCKGAEPMAREFAARGIAPALIVVGEPTGMRVVKAHKAIVSYETIVTGREAHSSMPEQGVNAVMLLGELIAALNAIRDDARARADAASGFPSPYSTVHVGTVEGGTARNIIPRHARMAWEVRPLPGETAEKILAPFHARVAALNATVRARFPECGIETRELSHVHGLENTDTAAHLTLAAFLAGGSNEPAAAVSYGTEGGMFGHHGFPTVVCGPGSIDQAHQPNEFVMPEQLRRCAEFLTRVAESCA